MNVYLKWTIGILILAAAVILAIRFHESLLVIVAGSTVSARVILIGLAIVVAVLILVFLLVWFYLAPRNYFFTFVKEGTAKIIVKGDQFAGALMQWEGRSFDISKAGKEKWTIIEKKSPNHLFGGLRYYGFWPIYDIYIYQFGWSGIGEDGEIARHSKEWLDYVLLKDDIYWAMVKGAEDNNLLPLDVELVITAHISNPYLALFNIQNWLETLKNQLEPAVRDVVSEKEYLVWITEESDMGKLILEECKKRSRGLITAFKNLYGITIVKIQVRSINPPEDYRQATLASYLAEMQKRATIIHAEAEEIRLQKVYGTIQTLGDVGRLVRTLEAAERSPLAASLTVQAVPGLSEAFKGVFGKDASFATKEDLSELKAMIEKLSPGAK